MTMKRCAINLTQLAAVALLAGGASRVSFGQVVAPAEIKDAKLRALESQHLAELTAAAARLRRIAFPRNCIFRRSST